MKRLLASSLAALLLCAGAASAQVLYGSLTGNVTDPSGAAVPGAKIEAQNVETGIARSGQTDERGAYLFTNLQSGMYKVTASAGSFRPMAQSNVEVNANEVRRINFKLEIAQTTETVEVAASSFALQTDKADVHAEVTSQEVTELPYSGGEGKNFQSLLFLIPGAGIIASPEANSEAGNPQRAITLFMNGVSSTSNSTKLDGATISYPWLPVNVAYVPPTEAVQQVNVSTNAFDPEQGAAGGAAVNVTIKSGTNNLHGVVFERNQNNDLAATNNVFSRPGNLSKNIFNQYGFAVGGPIWIPKVVHGKDKLFFFADYQGTKRRQYASDPNLTLPNDAMRKGDFSAISTLIYDPLTGNADGTGRTPFPGNVVPGNRIAPQAVTLTGLLPELTRPTTFNNNYDAYGGTQYNRSNWDFKVNYNPNEKSMIWGRYSFSPMDIVAPMVLGPAAGDAFNGGNPGHAGGRVQTTATGFTYTLSPTLVLDGNVGYTRQNIGANGDPQDADYGTDVLHIPNTNGVGPNYYGIPGFQVSGVANIGNTNTGSPFQFRDNQYTTGINLSKMKGSHSLRFGFQYDHYALNHFQPQGGTFGTARGTFGFDGTLTALKGGPAVNAGGPFNSWAQFLLGYPSHVGKITQFQNPNALRFSDWSFYARDQWQVSSRLTITYGLRWEYYPIFSHDNYGAVRFDPTTDNILIGGEGGVPWNAGATASKKGFAPRFGAAYRLNEKTVVRSGFGITVDPDNMRNQRNAFPSVINQDYSPLNTYQFISYIGVPNAPQVSQVTLANGLPAPTYPDITVGTLKPSPTASTSTYLPSTGTTTFAGNMNRGYYESWNIFLQREFTPTLTAEVGYAGTHGVHTMMGVNINGSAPGTGTAGRQLYPYVTSDMNSYEPFGTMSYNGLQTRFRKRIGQSLIGVSYTFAKAIDYANGDNGDATLFRAFPVSYTLNKQLAGFDRTHTFQYFYVYVLPVGKGQRFLNHGPAAWVVGGWQLGGNISRFSGLPFTVGSNASVNAGGQGQTASQINPNVAILGGHDASNPYFDGTAFINPAANTLGTTGRDILRGPGYFTWNQNISRNFLFKDGKIKFQLIGEAFNLTNTPVFGSPSATCANGYPTATSCWTTNSNGTPNYAGFGIITSTVSNPRQLQVGGYLRF
jgi:Carboxypeptidase regulatory-like domain